MNKKLAGLLFLAVCIILALLLITKTITSTVSGLIFAVSLILFGLLSKGFRKQ
ncbi:MAG: hypothetical protein AB1521_03800 [Bacteroidota bacterium]